MALMILLVGALLAVGLAGVAFQAPTRALKRLAAGGSVFILALAVVASSVRHIGADEVGIVVKNVGTKSLQGTAYIAVGGEQGIQADVLSPGWHFGFWPMVYDVREVPLTEVPSGKVGIIESRDGKPLPQGQVIAPEWPQDQVQRMLDARHYLTAGGGYRGTQATVLTSGKYRLNTELFKVKMVDVTEVLQGEVAVLKANFGTPPTHAVPGVPGLLETARPGSEGEDDRLRLAAEGEMGVRHRVLPPGKYPLNTDAFTVVEVWTTQMIAQFTAGRGAQFMQSAQGMNQNVATKSSVTDPGLEEREIVVRTSDGFTFPVDVRIEYVIEPRNAPIVVAKLGDDEGERFRNMMNSAVRAIFRNNAERVRALDYVQQRSQQESQSLTMLAQQMERFGVTVTAVRIGNVGDEQTLGALLKTQTDRELAKQEQQTFQEQQRAAEQQKQLTRTKQEAEEEKRLATAAYAVKIATEEQKRKITEAEAEAQSTTIKAKAQADAYRLIAEQIGRGNAALVEVLKIVGERNIQIAPRVMVTGGPTAAASGETTALIGTMLDTMVSREPDPTRPAPAQPATLGRP